MEMQRNGAKSPWDFERYYVELYSKAYSASCMQAIPGARADARDLLGYKNGVLQGKWIRATLRFYKKQGIKLDTSGREIMSVKDTVNYNLKVFGALYLKGKFGGTLKKVLRVFGYKFMS